eukprot:m.14396 g.14396  ORF g.14396 m.14396 type:complete len:1094 (+) comp25728_c0_seq2:350-3631(+)
MMTLLFGLLALATTVAYELNPDCSHPTVDIQTGVRRLRCDPVDAFNGGSFKALYVEPTEKQLIVGGRNRLYAFDYDFNLINRITFRTDYSERGICMLSGFQPTDCQNFIRVIKVRNGSLFTCGSNAKEPLCHYRRITNISHIEETVSDAHQICTDNPDGEVTVQLPANSTAIFSGYIDKYSYGVTRHFGGLPQVETDFRTSNVLRAPRFIGSFTVGEHVYFFIRELSDETGKTAAVANVVRVCQNDPGGGFIIRNQWLTYVKSRFKCIQHGAFGTYPYEYEHLTGTSVVEKDGRRFLFATFQPPVNGPASGAVCVFGFDGQMDRDVVSVFKGEYVSGGQEAFKKSFHDLCNGHRSEVDATQFISTINHIQQATKEPLLTQTGYRYVSIVADSFDRRNHAFFLATDSGVVEKHFVTFSGNGRLLQPKVTHLYSIQAIPLDVLPANPILTMKLNLEHKVIFLGTETLIVRVPSAACKTHSHDCSDCLVTYSDPQCGWCANDGKCTTKDDCFESVWAQNSTTCSNLVSPEKPRLLNQLPEIVSLSKGDIYVVCCASSGRPTPSYWWFKDGNMISGHNQENLTVEAVTASVGGQYSCTAHNKFGNASMKVTIKVKPYLTSTPPTLTFGSPLHSVVFPCSAEGFPHPLIHWHRNGLRMKTSTPSGTFVSTNGDLVLSRGANKQDQGVYRCTAVNEAGTEVAYSYLYSDPKSNVSDDTIIAHEGHNITLSCPLPSSNSTSWSRNGESLSDLVGRNSTVTLQSIGYFDTGVFQCGQKDFNGSTHVAYLNVLVIGPPILGFEGSLYRSFTAGQTLKLNVSVFSEPQSYVTWFKDGSPFDFMGGHVFVSDVHTLLISDLRPEDTGTYTCVAVNSVGREEVSVIVEVLELPKVQCPTPSMSLVAGSDTLLLCNVTNANMNYEIQWLKDGHHLQIGNNLEAFNLTGIVLEDEGEYSCVVKSKAGETSCQWWVTVTEDGFNVGGVSGNDIRVTFSAGIFAAVLIGTVLFGLIVGSGLVYCIMRKRMSNNSKCFSMEAKFSNGVPKVGSQTTDFVHLKKCNRSRVDLPSTSSLAPLTEIPEGSNSPTESSTASEFSSNSGKKSPVI